MNQQALQGISREGLDAAFETDEARKSKLLLEAQLLRERGRDDEAVAGFAQAAQLEESLSQRCLESGLVEKFFVHRFSAASCWAQAGNFYRAIELCDELLTRADLPVNLRQRIQLYVHTLRVRRAHLREELALETAGD